MAALSVDEWKGRRAAEARAETALESIGEELAANREAVQSSLDYHHQKSRFLFGYANPDSVGRRPSSRSFPRGFVSPAQVLSTAWLSAREIGALETLDYDLVLRLSLVYAQQERYERQKSSVAQIIYSKLLDQGDTGMLEKPTNLGMIVGTFAYREQELLETYDEILPDLGIQP